MPTGVQVRSVVHSKSEWSKPVRVAQRCRLAGMQQIDRCWRHLKKFLSTQMKTRQGETLNGKIWERIFQWIYRRNSKEKNEWI